MNETESKIVSVIVYSDRAQISRQAKLSLKAGEHILCFDKLPRKTERNSIQANGKGSGILKDIKLNTVH